MSSFYQVIYDEQCEICQAGVSWLKILDHDKRIVIHPIDPDTLPRIHLDLKVDACLRELHVITPDGKIVVGADAVILLATVAVTTLAWIVATFVTQPESSAVLESFYRRVRPGGPGWAEISERLGFGREPIPGGALAWTNWFAGIVAVYSTLFGIGKVVFGELGSGVGLLALALIAFIWIARSFRNEAPPPAVAARDALSMAAD